MSPKSTSPKSTRDRILEVAVEKFWSQGFASTSLAGILTDAGVHGGSLYHFFRSKESLLLAVLDRHSDQLDVQIFAPALRRSPHPVERIFHVLAVYREFLESTGCRMGCPIGNLALELADTRPPVRVRIAEILDRWAQRILELLEEARPLLRRDVDLEGLSRFVLTVMEGGVMQAKALRSLEPFDASVAHLRWYFDTLVATGADQPPAIDEPR